MGKHYFLSMSELFDTLKNNITIHIKNIFKENEAVEYI